MKNYDINFGGKFYWCECSSAIENCYDKFDGFKIPNTYAQEILNIKSEADKPIVFMDDGYHYRRYNKSLERYFTKIIYGFNSHDTFNKIIEKETALYKKWLDEIEHKHIDESYQFTDKMQIAFDIIDFFYRMTHDAVQFYPPYAIEKLKEYVDFVKSELDRNSYYSRYTKSEIEELYETGIEMLDYCCVLKLNKGYNMRMIKERLCSRKLKKAIKNYPCRKTKLGRYVINAYNSCWEEHYIANGYDAYDVVYDCFKFNQIADIINGKLSFVIRYPDYDGEYDYQNDDNDFDELPF